MFHQDLSSFCSNEATQAIKTLFICLKWLKCDIMLVMDTDLIVVNLKEDMPPVDIALCNMELEIELAKISGVKAIKFIHGYGSSGQGGLICRAVRERLASLKKQRIIKEYIFGEDWNLDNPKCFKIITSLKSGFDGEDLNNFNAGMTIVVV